MSASSAHKFHKKYAILEILLLDEVTEMNWSSFTFRPVSRSYIGRRHRSKRCVLHRAGNVLLTQLLHGWSNKIMSDILGPVLTRIVNLSFDQGRFPNSKKKCRRRSQNQEAISIDPMAVKS